MFDSIKNILEAYMPSKDKVYQYENVVTKSSVIKDGERITDTYIKVNDNGKIKDKKFRETSKIKQDYPLSKNKIILDKIDRPYKKLKIKTIKKIDTRFLNKKIDK